MYDLIGDIHGHADALEALLKQMGYEKQGSSYRHPERKALFIGDYIDRGPKIKETLEIVRNMVEADEAIALMGNHEYNAICFHLENGNGGHLRKHTLKNISQHADTILQFKDKQGDYNSHIEWFMSLPLYYENEHFRAVHACWDDAHIEFLNQQLTDARLMEAQFHEASNEDTDLFKVIEDTLKGKELRLPEGVIFEDKYGHPRKHTRIKWWEDYAQHHYKSISVHPHGIPEIPINLNSLNSRNFYGSDEKPAFFGHYWRTGGPELFRDNVCCLDFSVAKEGNLAAYRWDGEQRLENAKWEHVKP
jgi:hypothetical protein